MYYVKIKTQFEGFHRYKDAPDKVAFLKDYHRHLFNLTAIIKTNHSNRDLEFFIIKTKIDAFLAPYSGWENRFEKSCEQIAEEVGIFLKMQGLDCTEVEVQEDNENSGIWTNKTE